MEDRVPSEIEVTTMTGTAIVECSHALDAIREMFISQLDGVSSQNKKAVWHNFCLVKAGVEVVQGDKHKKEDLTRKIREKYDRWAKLIVEEDEGLGFDGVPKYVTEHMFNTQDSKNLKVRANTPTENLRLWRQWVVAKSQIINIDNLAVRAAINRMPGKVLPSGTDFSLFLDRLLYELYIVQSTTARKENQELDELGGSDAKATSK